MQLAVLIDAENVSSKVAEALFTEISRIGETCVRRIYGDFSGPRLEGWAECLARHAIIPRQQFANTVGKNASDIALVIDAMDLLLSNRYDGFCLVSSDGDFTRLAARIREHGLRVYGFGKRTTPQGFQSFCQRFVYTEDLLQNAATEIVKNAQENSSLRGSLKASDALPLILDALAKTEAKDGWTPLSSIGQILRSFEPGLDVKGFGYKKLSDLLRATGRFDLVSHQKVVRIRERRNANTT
jgi:hypothetical protein